MDTLFPLRENTLEIRGRTVKVRELTQRQRTEIAEMAAIDRYCATAAFAAKGCVDPAMTVEQAQQMPSEVIGAISKEVMRLTGIDVSDDDDKKTGDDKAKNA